MIKKTQKLKKADEDGFPERLKQLRIQKNLSQSELAELAGLSSIHISRYERGVSKPTANNLGKLADVLEVSGDYLFDGKEEGAAIVHLADRKILNLFQEIENLQDEDKNFVLKVVDALLTNIKIKEMTTE